MAEVSEDELTPAPTTAESKAIRAIAKDSVHKICSGQVVLSLAVAVKELVENSIDAGATLIEVKLKDQGLESLEVSDNGCGVKEENLEGMTAKYHTSKIREFDDLQGVETFGFRGEALSSLCALSDMVIVTRHSSTDVAVRLELDHEGQIKKRSPCAGTVGTTVTLTNLFATLPVRKREFKRNIKKEFTKMCQILQAYCLVSKGVRIICTNHTPKGAKSVLMKTNGVDDVLENISAIFGPKQTADIIELKMPKLSNDEADVTGADESKTDDLNTEDGAAAALSKDEIEIATQFKLEGYVSSCSHGAGRSSRDRQYYYINSRPFDPKHVAKLVNEVYHRYNVNQYPFVYLNVLTKRSDVDVNLTPDKRQLLINHEKILLFFIKKALIHTYGHIPSTYKVQNKSISSMFKIDNKDEADETQSVDGLLEEEEVPPTTQKRFMEVLSQWKRTGDTKGIAPALSVPKRKRSDEIETRTLKLRKIQEYLNRETSEVDKKGCSYASEDDSDEDGVKKTEKSVSVHQGSILDMDFIKTEANEFDDLINNESLKDNTSAILQRIVCKNATPKNSLHKQLHFIPSQDALSSTPTSSQSSTQPLSQNMNEDEEALFTNSTTPQIILDEGEPENEVTIAAVPSCEISTSIAEIELNLAAEENIRQEQSKMKLERLRFKSEISPSQNTNAEQELQREISKDMFAKMEILGQFNLGFIITKLDTDLFIVDQHATDEKYNFETLQQTVVLHHQPLAVPQLLDMTAVNEMVLLDHLAVFEKNGFKFDINHDAPATKKVRLLGKPCSKNWEFGKDDIDELIFMLQDAPEGAVCRPSRIRAMFASRACHKSVRIGQALKRSTMKQLVTHMGEIEQPWNCPHGRPTMRHLINIAMLHDIKEDIKVVIKEEI